MIDFPDIQKSKPDISLSIQKVGVKGVVYPIDIIRKDRQVHLYCNIDAFVDIPASRKGADLSRTIEAIGSVGMEKGKAGGVEFLAEEISKGVFKRFPYSSMAEVHLEADYFSERSGEMERKHVVKYRILSDSIAKENDCITTVGVVVQGINACPCAMETTRAMRNEEFPEFSGKLDKLPSISHNQRNRVTVCIQTDREHQLEIDDLIGIAEMPVNGPLLSILKRKEEGELVYRAHKRPMFVEDIVREIAMGIAQKYEGFPDDFTVEITSESEESIHPHNAYARISTTIGKLRKIAP